MYTVLLPGSDLSFADTIEWSTEFMMLGCDENSV